MYPHSLSAKVFAKTVALDMFTDQELYWWLSTLSPEKVKDYFTDKEIKKYSVSAYQEVKEETINIPCVEVVEGEQWIGAVEDATEFFLNLRNRNKIYYNPNAQRAMTMQKMKDGKVLWRITLNKTVLKKIRECFTSKKFVPNTITLNIDPDTDTVIKYDNRAHVLSISNLDHFDITDGFHRYMGLCIEKDNNSEFSYPMEIRITRFSDNKASYFVWQEDQKTPMKRFKSDSYNTETLEYKIVKRLNENDGFLQDRIGRGGTLISFSDLNLIIQDLYVKKLEKPYDNATVIKNVSKELGNRWTNFNDDYPEYFKDKKIISFEELYIIVLMLKHNYPMDHVREIVEEFSNKLKEDNLFYGLINRPKIEKLAINIIEKERK